MHAKCTAIQKNNRLIDYFWEKSVIFENENNRLFWNRLIKKSINRLESINRPSLLVLPSSTLRWLVFHFICAYKFCRSSQIWSTKSSIFITVFYSLRCSWNKVYVKVYLKVLSYLFIQSVSKIPSDWCSNYYNRRERFKKALLPFMRFWQWSKNG